MRLQRLLPMTIGIVLACIEERAPTASKPKVPPSPEATSAACPAKGGCKANQSPAPASSRIAADVIGTGSPPPWNPGYVFVGVGNGTYQVYDSIGRCKQTS